MEKLAGLIKKLFLTVKRYKWIVSSLSSSIKKLFLIVEEFTRIVKTVVLLISILLLIYFSYFYIYHTRIIANDIVLPESLVRNGINPRIITKASVVGIHQSVLNSLKSHHKNTSDHKINKSSGASECTRTDIEIPGADDLLINMLTKVSLQSDIPDIEITSHKFPFSSIILFVKKIIGSPYIEINSSLSSAEDGYKLTINAINQNEQQAHIKTLLSSEDDLRIALSEGFAKIVSPEVFAYKKNALEPSDIKDELHIAENILKNKDKTALIRMMQMDSLEFSRTQADQVEDIIKAYLISKEVQNSYDLSFLEDSQYAAKLNLISSQVKYISLMGQLLREKSRPNENEVFRKGQSDNEFQEKYKEIPLEELYMSDGTRKKLNQLRIDANSIYKASNKTYTDSLMYSNVLIELNNGAESINIYKKLLEDLNTDKTIPKQTRSFLKTWYMVLLTAQNETEELNKFIKKEKYENLYFRTDYQNINRAYFDVYEATMLLRKKQQDMAISLLKNAKLAKYPCVELILLDKIIYKKEFLNLVNERLTSIEENSFYNNHFYNLWGNLLRNMGKYEESYKKFKTALLYPGDKVWVLLNWGYAALQAHNYPLATTKFLESLEYGTVYKAASGLLQSLSYNNNSKEYMTEYRRYYELLDISLSSSKYEANRILFSKWAYAHHCRSNDNSELKLLSDKSLLDLDKFDSKSCEWHQNVNEQFPALLLEDILSHNSSN